MLYLPGNAPGMLADPQIYGSDSIMFDLEDSVALSEKDSARFLVFNALKTVNYGSIEKVVRINHIHSPFGMQDLEAMVRAGVNIIRLPKTDTAEDVIEAEAAIARIEAEAGMEVGSTGMMAAIEGPIGVLNALAIAKASPRLIGIAIGAEDYVTEMKTRRSPDGEELAFARGMLVNAARAAGIAALDTVFSDINNEEGFCREVELIKRMGFDGKSVINPRQIAPVHRIYAPTAKEIEQARKIIQALEEAKAKGSGVISLNGKMIDKPIVDRAVRTLELAEAMGEAVI